MAIISTFIIINIPIYEKFSQPLLSVYSYLVIVFFGVSIFYLFSALLRGRWHNLSEKDILCKFMPFFAIATASFFFHLNSYPTGVQMGIFQLAKWAEIPFACFIAANVLNSKLKIRITLNLYLVATFFIALVCIKLYFTDISTIDAHSRLSFGFHPNTVAAAINTILPLCIGMLVGSRNFLKKMLALVTSTMLFYLLFRTHSRSAMVSLVVLLVIWFITLTAQKRISVAFIVILLVSGFLLWLFEHSTKFSTRFNVFSPTKLFANMQTRLILYAEALILAIKNPLLGVGPGLHGLLIKKTGVIIEETRFLPIMQAHSIYFQVLAETGFIGMFFFLRFLVHIFKRIKQAFSVIAEDRYYYIIGTSMILSIVIFALHNLTDITLRSGIGLQIGINLGIFLAIFRIVSKQSQRKEGAPNALNP